MTDTTVSTLAVTAASIRFPASLWRRARLASLDLNVSANQLVVEGLELRLARLDVAFYARRNKPAQGGKATPGRRISGVEQTAPVADKGAPRN